MLVSILAFSHMRHNCFVKLLELAREEGILTLGHLRRRLELPVARSGDVTDTSLSKQVEHLRVDGKRSSSVAVARPNGSLFLNLAWKRDFPTKPGIYLMKDVNHQVIYVGKA